MLRRRKTQRRNKRFSQKCAVELTLTKAMSVIEKNAQHTEYVGKNVLKYLKYIFHKNIYFFLLFYFTCWLNRYI